MTIPSPLVRLLIAASLAGFITFFATPASAQGCPFGPGYGQRIVGVNSNTGEYMCGPDPEMEEPALGSSGSGSRADPRDAAVRGMNEVLGGLANSMQYMRELMIKMAEVEEGRWIYSSPEQSCSATYVSPDGFVRIDGPSQARSTPILTFYSTRVVKPKAHQIVDIAFENNSLDSGQSATLAVRGINWPSEDMKGGYISLQLASDRVLIRGLEDRMRFKLSIAGKPQVDLAWNRGAEAKARLAKCLRL